MCFITSGGKRFTIFWLCLINFRGVDWNKFSKLIIKLSFTSAVNYEIILINRPKCLVALNYLRDRRRFGKVDLLIISRVR
ncbi:MAG: hypothetical protein ACTS5A_00995 [Candidatus Hodgkinia cicadicola]